MPESATYRKITAFRDLKTGDQFLVIDRSVEKLDSIRGDHPIYELLRDPTLTLIRMVEAASDRDSPLSLRTGAGVIATLDHLVEVNDFQSDLRKLDGYFDDLNQISLFTRRSSSAINEFLRWSDGIRSTAAAATPSGTAGALDTVPFWRWDYAIHLAMERLAAIAGGNFGNPDTAGEVLKYARVMTALLEEHLHGRFDDLPLGTAIQILAALDYLLVVDDRIPDTRDDGLNDDLDVLRRVALWHKETIHKFCSWYEDRYRNLGLPPLDRRP